MSERGGEITSSEINSSESPGCQVAKPCRRAAVPTFLCSTVPPCCAAVLLLTSDRSKEPMANEPVLAFTSDCGDIICASPGCSGKVE